MEEKTLNALRWIVGILDRHDIPYRIGGGFAAHVYGANRPIHDIDISLSGTYFPIIVPLVHGFIATGPKHYLNEKWDCTTLSLEYHGQEIDLTDVDTLLMRSQEGTEWIRNREIYEKWPDIKISVDGTVVTLMHPRVLLEYKKHLSGEHQDFDRKYLEEYIATHQL
jgi:hypothetical protein